MESITAPLELKFADAQAGEFDGLASAFGVVDSHGDVVAPGAFAASLAQYQARGMMPAMYVQHGPALGGDLLPAGVWTKMEEAPDGLRVKGRLSALDTDYGKRVRGLMADGALRSLSIGFRVAPGGAAYGKKAGEPRRTLKAVSLVEVSIVTAGSNPNARVENLKASGLALEIEDMKSRVANGDMPTRREVERFLRDAMGLSRAQAEAFAGSGFKALSARESEGEANTPARRAALESLGATLAGFSLPSFK